MVDDRTRATDWRPVAVAILVAVAAAGCGSGTGLPSSVSGSLPSLPGSVPPLPSSLPSRPSTTSPTTPTTTSPPPTTSTTPPPVTSPSTSVSTSGTTSLTVSQTTPAQPDDTPWPAIVIGLLVLGGLLLLAVWALGRRHGSQATWHSLAHQAVVDGTAAHDAALGALLAATTANDPERWHTVSIAMGELAASLQRLVGSAPDDGSRLVAQQAFDGVTALGSAVDVAAMAPAAAPLDEGAALTLRQRLDAAQSALGDLARSARG